MHALLLTAFSEIPDLQNAALIPALRRWRMHGEFSDCTAIARLLRGGSADGCLFADVGGSILDLGSPGPET